MNFASFVIYFSSRYFDPNFCKSCIFSVSLGAKAQLPGYLVRKFTTEDEHFKAIWQIACKVKTLFLMLHKDLHKVCLIVYFSQSSKVFSQFWVDLIS